MLIWATWALALCLFPLGNSVLIKLLSVKNFAIGFKIKGILMQNPDIVENIRQKVLPQHEKRTIIHKFEVPGPPAYPGRPRRIQTVGFPNYR